MEEGRRLPPTEKTLEEPIPLNSRERERERSNYCLILICNSLLLFKIVGSDNADRRSNRRIKVNLNMSIFVL